MSGPLVEFRVLVTAGSLVQIINFISYLLALWEEHFLRWLGNLRMVPHNRSSGPILDFNIIDIETLIQNMYLFIILVVMMYNDNPAHLWTFRFHIYLVYNVCFFLLMLFQLKIKVNLKSTNQHILLNGCLYIIRLYNKFVFSSEGW